MTALVQVAPEPPPLLPMEPDKARVMMERYRELCESVLGAEDVIGIPGQPGGFVKRSGWSKLATFYSVTTTILRQDSERGTWNEQEGVLLRSHAIVRAESMNGRHADGDGACAVTEPRFKSGVGRQKIEHDLPATAVTRATNRAISNLIGFGAVSAEEVDGDATPADRPYGAAASGAEEDGLLRALGDLGAGPAPANRIVNECGYLPRIAARAVMFTARDVADRAKAAAAEEGGPGYEASQHEAAAEAAGEEPVPWEEEAATAEAGGDGG
jgi:hypothetical protein